MSVSGFSVNALPIISNANWFGTRTRAGTVGGNKLSLPQAATQSMPTWPHSVKWAQTNDPALTEMPANKLRFDFFV